MKKNYLIILPAFIGIYTSCLAIEQKTAYEVATCLFETHSVLGTKDSTAVLIDSVKKQSKEYGVDEKEVVKILIQKIVNRIASYQKYQTQPKTKFNDSTKALTVGTLGITLSCLLYYCSQDNKKNTGMDHFLNPKDIRKDPASGAFFLSDDGVKSLIQSGGYTIKNDFLKNVTISAIILSWGMLLRAKEWYMTNNYTKNLFLRNELEDYLNRLQETL